MARSDYASLTRDELLTVIERLEARITQQDAHILRLEARIKQLEDLLDQATRGGKRQAAPFSKGAPKPDPQKPGRKPGEAHGRHAHRQPPPTPPDEVIDVPAPSACPDCGGAVRPEGVVHQHQVEIPRRPLHRCFDLHVGRCRRCGRRIQPRHALQTSDALGAAACQLGPDAQTTVALMKNRFGLSYGDIVGLFQDVFGISLSPGGAEPTERPARFDSANGGLRRVDRGRGSRARRRAGRVPGRLRRQPGQCELHRARVVTGRRRDARLHRRPRRMDRHGDGAARRTRRPGRRRRSQGADLAENAARPDGQSPCGSTARTSICSRSPSIRTPHGIVWRGDGRRRMDWTRRH